MISNEIKTKKFIALVNEKYSTNNQKEIIISSDDFTGLCNKSEYLPNSHSERYAFISFLISCGILERVRNGRYIYNAKKAGVFL
jgi:hypothetical protein